jgi:hypothetical protein
MPALRTAPNVTARPIFPTAGADPRVIDRSPGPFDPAPRLGSDVHGRWSYFGPPRSVHAHPRMHTVTERGDILRFDTPSIPPAV